MYKLNIRSNFFLSVGIFFGLAIAIPDGYGRLEIERGLCLGHVRQRLLWKVREP